MSSTGLGLEQNKGYNECLDDLQAALPTLLSTMEAEIRERIGKKASHRDNPKHSKDEIYCCLECYKDEQINAERSRIHSIIKEYFTPRV